MEGVLKRISASSSVSQICPLSSAHFVLFSVCKCRVFIPSQSVSSVSISLHTFHVILIKTVSTHGCFQVILLQVYFNKEYIVLYSCYTRIQIRSDQISRSVVSDSLRPHESQHARPSCPSPTPGVHSDSRPSSQ